jgi:very-short-patch-repair endonuclease
MPLPPRIVLLMGQFRLHVRSLKGALYNIRHGIKKRPLRVYKPKGQYLLSVGENKFYDALLAALDSTRYIIFAKVRIADIIETNLDKTDPMYWKKLAPINQKHIDFLLVSRSDTTPLLAIELDGGSHSDKARLKRDAFVDSIFHNAGIPLMHIPVKGFYQYNDLRNDIETTILRRQDQP